MGSVSTSSATTDLNETFNKGRPQLVKECMETEIVDAKSNINSTTGLMTAASLGSVDLVSHLLDSKADVNAKDERDFTALMYAKACNRVDVIELLKAAGADEDGETPLMLASMLGEFDVVTQMTQPGSAVDQVNSNGESPLMCAAKAGHHDIVNLLIKQDANLNLKDDDGSTALINASFAGHVNVVRALIDANASVNEADENLNALIYSSGLGHRNIVKLLLSSDASIDEKGRYGETALICAATNGHLDVVEALIHASASIDDVDDYGSTALIVACKGGHEKVVQALLNSGASPNICDCYQNTALLFASGCGSDFSVKKLLDSRASVNAKGEYGLTPLMNACEEGHHSVVRILLKAEASLSETYQDGKSALDFATERGHYDVLAIIENFDRWDSRRYMISRFAQNHLQTIGDLLLTSGYESFRDLWDLDWTKALPDELLAYADYVISREREKMLLEQLLASLKDGESQIVHIACNCINRNIHSVSGAMIPCKEYCNAQKCFCRSCISFDGSGTMWVGVFTNRTAWVGLDNLTSTGSCRFCRSCGSRIFIRSYDAKKDMLWINASAIQDSTFVKVSEQSANNMESKELCACAGAGETVFIPQSCQHRQNLSCSLSRQTKSSVPTPLLEVRNTTKTCPCVVHLKCIVLLLILLCPLLIEIWRIRVNCRSQYAFH